MLGTVHLLRKGKRVGSWYRRTLIFSLQGWVHGSRSPLRQDFTFIILVLASGLVISESKFIVRWRSTKILRAMGTHP